MSGLLKWLFRIAAGVVVLAVLSVAVLYMLLARSLPDYDKRLSVAGITAPVEIVRDNANVPHIFGASDEDVFFALGYAHAQDRLWQMVMMRRKGSGDGEDGCGEQFSKKKKSSSHFGSRGRRQEPWRAPPISNGHGGRR